MNGYGKRVTAIALTIGVVSLVATAAGAVGGTGESPHPTMLHSSSFSWLQPEVAPAGWSTAKLSGSAARLPAPPGWRHEHGDAGTRTEVLRTGSGRIVGYLNATPRQGAESLRNWAEFRVDHNRDEGDRQVKLLADATRLPFRSAMGSCVLDSYRTESGHPYREIACIVSGRSATTVIVGAAPPLRWESQAPTLEQAIDSFTT